MQKSKQINFHLPQALITGLDDYLAHSDIDIGRSALLKFCLTYKPSLTMMQKQKSARLQDDLYRSSNGLIINVSLRCHYGISNGMIALSNICDTLVFLDLDNVFNM